MSRGIVAAAFALLAAGVLAADTPPAAPREGKISATKVMSGSFQVVPLGKDRARGMYDVMGVELGEGGLLHNASARCIGAMTITNGAWDDESGNCIYTLPDGDQVFTAHRGAGKIGGETKGTWTYLGGTGKLVGIQGSGEWSRYAVRRAAEGTSQSVTRSTGTYKVPAATASK